MSFLSGKSDPYVKIFMNSENQAITPVISDNLNPVWNHSTIMRTYRDDVKIQFNVRLVFNHVFIIVKVVRFGHVCWWRYS